VRRYPAIFVDDVLVATPKDFGFYGKGEGAGDGRYTPFQRAESHERFRSDLSKMIELILAGRKDEARSRAPQAAESVLAGLPDLGITDFDGHPLTRTDLAGRAVLVEFWATWCPPCRKTLAWLGELKKKYGDRIAIVALAVQSDEADVRKLVAELKLPLSWSMATPDLARSFGDITSVPTMFLFNRSGKSAGAFYGAPPTLHRDAESRIASIAD